MDPETKTKIFDALENNDIVKVIMEFSGGHDEGSADGWEFYLTNGESEFAAPAPLLADYKKIEEDMEEVMLEHFDFFGNQPSAWGEVEWDVPARKVILRAEQEVTATEKFTEEL